MINQILYMTGVTVEQAKRVCSKHGFSVHLDEGSWQWRRKVDGEILAEGFFTKKKSQAWLDCYRLNFAGKPSSAEPDWKHLYEKLRADHLLNLERIVELTAPIPMLLKCPECGKRHVDVGKFKDEPHHTHACQSCGCIWRPAIQNTVGVHFLPGFKNA